MPKNRGKKLLTLQPDVIADNSGDIVAVTATNPEPEGTTQLPTWKELALQAQKILCKLFEPCPVCYKPMVPVSWSGDKVSVVCGNYACNKFRQPARYVQKDDIKSLVAQINNLELAETTRILGNNSLCKPVGEELAKSKLKTGESKPIDRL